MVACIGSTAIAGFVGAPFTLFSQHVHQTHKGLHVSAKACRGLLSL